MRYFDTDVLVNAIVIQDEHKHKESIDLITDSIENGSFLISLLVLQELVFVLSKLGCSNEFIKKYLNYFTEFALINYDADLFTRASELADQIGYKNINDCLHVAMAEKYCNEIITYNKKDFKNITDFSTTRITIL